MKPGDIVLIRFPKTDLTTGKLRPALIIAQTPGRHDDVLLALITSQLHQNIIDFDEVITDTDPDFLDSGLKTSSVIRLSRIAVVDKTAINARLGMISAARLLHIKSRIAAWVNS